MISQLVRKEVRFSGRVQGVGFRYSTRSIAANYEVTGYVKNLLDGRVELIAEGAAEQVDSFLQDINDRMGRCIHNVQTTTLQATGQFADFDITY
ncbi:MAG: acylphosphatase [Chloroflexi bacterium]|nr:acylphosphatase [Chloroflexota bacterium]